MEIKTISSKINLLEIIRYGAFGLSVFAFDLFLYWFFVNILGVWYVVANLIATPIVWIYMFIIHKFFTFRSKKGLFRESARFLVLTLFNSVAIPLMLYVQVELIGINYIIAKIIATGIVVCWNYPLYKYWVYSAAK